MYFTNTLLYVTLLCKTIGYVVTRDEKMESLICKYDGKFDANYKFGYLCPFLHWCKAIALLYICNHCKGANAAVGYICSECKVNVFL